MRHFVEGGTMPEAGVLNILEWRAALLVRQSFAGVPPLEIATTLHTNASGAPAALSGLHRASLAPTAAKDHGHQEVPCVCVPSFSIHPRAKQLQVTSAVTRAVRSTPAADVAETTGLRE